MNLNNIFARRVNDISLAVTLVQLCGACNSANPLAAFAAVRGESPLDPHMSFFPGTDQKTNSIIADDGNQLLICIGGALRSVQVGAYIEGVAAGPDSRDNLGSARNFYGAARSHLNDSFARGSYVGKDVIIAGHSYGGAVAQVAGAYLLSLGQARSVRMISFGSPRPGGPQLARRLATTQNVRWMAAGDIVPWLLPHLDEIPAMGIVAAHTLWGQSNHLVQAPEGYQVNTFGVVTASMGSPPRNWGYFLSLNNYVSGLMVGNGGFNHSSDAYRLMLLAADAANPSPLPIPSQQPEATTTLRPRERDALIETGRRQIIADATAPTGITRTYVVPPVTSLSSPHYKPARDGAAWVIKLGTVIVGAATGKRNAKKICRHWNRAARAALRN